VACFRGLTAAQGEVPPARHSGTAQDSTALRHRAECGRPHIAWHSAHTTGPGSILRGVFVVGRSDGSSLLANSRLWPTQVAWGGMGLPVNGAWHVSCLQDVHRCLCWCVVAW